jgi:hypothetical protein
VQEAATRGALLHHRRVGVPSTVEILPLLHSLRGNGVKNHEQIMNLH